MKTLVSFSTARQQLMVDIAAAQLSKANSSHLLAFMYTSDTHDVKEIVIYKTYYIALTTEEVYTT